MENGCFYSNVSNQREKSEAHKEEQHRLETSKAAGGFVLNCSK